MLAITTDNASNNDSFINALGKICKRDNIDFHGKSQHVRCCAHVLNLSVQDGLAELKATAPEDEDSILCEGSSPASDVIPKVGVQCHFHSFETQMELPFYPSLPIAPVSVHKNSVLSSAP